MYRMEMVELYRQDELARKFEQLFTSVLEDTGKVGKSDTSPSLASGATTASLAAGKVLVSGA